MLMLHGKFTVLTIAIFLYYLREKKMLCLFLAVICSSFKYVAYGL